MNKASRGRRTQRQAKAARRWQTPTPSNKKGRDPRQGRPFEKRAYGIVEPSRKAGGLQALIPLNAQTPAD